MLKEGDFWGLQGLAEEKNEKLVSPERFLLEK